jgi:conjugal transfer pilus assembly protein TraK
MICSSENLARFIVCPSSRPDSNRSWRKIRGSRQRRCGDQFRQAADGSSIECTVSARELTRFALVDDQFASVSKISSGTPYNDFAVTNEPLRGDIYVSVPETFAARAISFFATTRKGFVYKIA